MNAHEYISIEKTTNGIASKLKALRDEQLPWYKSEALRIFDIRELPSRTDDQLVEQSFAKSPSDHFKKQQNHVYYRANVVQYLSVMDYLLSEQLIDNFEQLSAEAQSSRILVLNYHQLFQDLLVDSLVVLNYFMANINKDESNIYPIGKSNHQPTFTIYQSLKQLVFGQVSFHSFAEVESNLSISIIRQLIELRVRRGLGILAWYDDTKDTVEPLQMHKLFELLKENEKDIDFSIPLSCLIRIYGWSNIFIHSGIQDFLWKPIFVINYLNKFACGHGWKNGFNMKDGLKIKRDALNAIIASLEAENKENKKNLKLVTMAPECIIT